MEYCRLQCLSTRTQVFPSGPPRLANEDELFNFRSRQRRASSGFCDGNVQQMMGNLSCTDLYNTTVRLEAGEQGIGERVVEKGANRKSCDPSIVLLFKVAVEAVLAFRRRQ
jgi:hypothetical protein